MIKSGYRVNNDEVIATAWAEVVGKHKPLDPDLLDLVRVLAK